MFEMFWDNVFHCRIKLHCSDIIFGIMNTNNIPMFDNLNFCILLVKQYIRKCHSENIEHSIDSFLLGLYERLKVEKCVLWDKPEMFTQTWGTIFNFLQLKFS